MIQNRSSGNWAHTDIIKLLTLHKPPTQFFVLQYTEDKLFEQWERMCVSSKWLSAAWLGEWHLFQFPQLDVWDGAVNQQTFI